MPEYDDFDLDRSTEQAWRNFEERLSEVVSVMDDTQDLTIGSVAVTTTETVPFVRFSAANRGLVRAEAASNGVLGEHYQLLPPQLEAFDEQGWKSPVSEGDRPTPNFWIELPQEESDTLARLAVVALRDIYGIQHPVFLAPDQLAEILQPDPKPLIGQSEFDAEDVTAVVPVNPEHLEDMIEAELAEMFGHRPPRDSEGDLTIRVGSTMLFIRVSADHREIIVFAPLVHEVEGRSRAMEILSDLNTEVRFIKFQLIRDRVFVSLSVFAHPFVPAHLLQAVRMMSEVADGIDDELASRLRGRTTFES
ncbi:T3SS (YopN, CesT) and YbjN peptide-binding chaperone 1 [Granulicoccus sp. GXG6511]|uniref:T3SS (YopN, CesT) and YbjN peptide-binding chaperone 1 n=1 Tax=Granulicoccus sp. GXG6511 TaxID=3381351 RepID=UPI003D7D2199